jgi:hypothetical protein
MVMVSTRAQILAVVMVSGIIAQSNGVLLAQGNRPRTQPVSGIFTGSPVNAKQRICEGQDGTYLEIRGHFSGAITGSDPRLTGTLDFMAEPALVNLATGFGTFRGRFHISDPATGRQKAQGEFLTVVTEASLNHGFAIGKVTNTGGGPADDFFASFTSTLDAALNVSGQFGGTGDPRTPAVIQGGHCTGAFTQVP